MTNEQIIKEFDEGWADLTYKSGSPEQYNQLKSFLLSKLSLVRNQTIDEVLEIILKHDWECFEQVRIKEDLTTALTKLKESNNNQVR